MKNMKKFLSVLLAIAVLSSLTMSVAAVPMQTATKTHNLSNEYLATPNIRLLITSYFSERTNFLQGNSSNIPSAITPIVNDENDHADALNAHQVTLLDTSFTILSIEQWDSVAEVSVTETVDYLIENVTYQYIIQHAMIVYCDSNGNLTVSSDAYYDEATEFYSCSYVHLPDSYTADVRSPGSRLCILNVAAGEVGVTEGSDGYTKYGAWYGWPREAWCAMFVSWCANQTNIPTSVIPKTAAVYTMKNHYASSSRFYLSESQGGIYTPQAGDLFFQLGTPSDPGHVGIVAEVIGTSIRVYDGNWNNKVNNRVISLSESSLVGFARVNYTSLNHSYTYETNRLKHWGVCDNCNHSTSPVSHNFVAEGSIYVCTTCGYQSEYTLQSFNPTNE